MRVAPRRLWGWEPAETTRYEYQRPEVVWSVSRWGWVRALVDWAWALANPPVLVEAVTEREPEFDKEQYELLAALYEHEASLNELGIPLDEAMSPDADPDNPNGKYLYRGKAMRDWSKQAVHDERQDPKWGGDNYTPAREFMVERIER